MTRFKKAHQRKLLIIAKEFSMRSKWNELKTVLLLLNKILTRYYLDAYWKYLFQYVSTKLPKSIESVPQFIEY